MTKKTLTRAEIAELLRPRPGRTADELASLTLDALEAALEGIAAGNVPGGYTIDSAAAAIGYLLSGCTEQAARAARQIVAPYALPPASRQATPAELLGGVARLRA
jgi:hypothetical protein